MPLPYRESVELEKVVPEENQERFYRMAIWPDLFGGVSLVCEYGRIGHRGGRLRSVPFPDQDAASQALQRILKRKLRRGYVPAGSQWRVDLTPPQWQP
jgi:predicted DNA-binding WGR domain protein